MNLLKNNQKTIDTTITPGEVMSILSPIEVTALIDLLHGKLYKLLRCCALAVLNSGNTQDSARDILAAHKNFKIEIIKQSRGIKLKLTNAPADAFVDGKIIRGIKEHLFSLIRDIVYIHHLSMHSPKNIKEESTQITDMVFKILRNAQILHLGIEEMLTICWGGHSINRDEYNYTKKVGYELGLRQIHVGTGCGPGAMKGPMKGAAIAHAKQHLTDGRYIGITEPSIIAAESPNPIVNELVILPDIEKRLEAFIRTAHSIIIFPGGVGTTEEILYLLGILLHPKNHSLPFPIIFTGPQSSAHYFQQINDFIGKTLGPKAQELYKIIIDDPTIVAQEVKQGIETIMTYRRHHKDAYYFNWLLHIPPEFQRPFNPTHENMAKLNLSYQLPTHELAVQLRCTFSGLVAGNIKDFGIRSIEKFGPYQIHGEPELMQLLDELLQAFACDGRMRLNNQQYHPCYQLHPC